MEQTILSLKDRLIIVETSYADMQQIVYTGPLGFLEVSVLNLQH